MLSKTRTLLLCSLLFTPLLGWAQTTYSVLLDTDSNSTTGCVITTPFALAGIEQRLTATLDMTNPGSPQIDSLILESCTGGSFAAPVPLPATPYPLGLNNGINGADVIELAVAADAIAPLGQAVRLYFVSANGQDADMLPDANTPIILPGLQQTPNAVPTLTEAGLAVLMLLFVVLLYRHLQGRGGQQLLSALLLVLVSGIVLAAALDGQVDDWTGQNPVGIDPLGDTVGTDTDLAAAFATILQGDLYFRLDVADVGELTDLPPVAVADTASITEDAPATLLDVLDNDTDTDGGPRSIASVTQPVNGTVVITNAGADLTYQPDPDYCNEGGPTDDFSYTLTPGGSTATVAVTVTCSNDPPVLTVPPSIPVVADTTNTLTGISASDVDAGNGNVTLNLSVPTPALAATGSGGVTVTGNTTALTLSGSLSALNSFIAGGNVSYTFNAYEITSTATGSGPLGTVIGDIDGDGQADIATANSNANSVSVLRNTSAGSITFAAPNDFSTGTNPRSIAAADLDGDGKLDLAVPNSNGNNSGPSTVSVLRNTSTAGAVSFASQITFTVGANPNSIAIDDIDGDGKPDLVVTNANVQSSDPVQTISVLRNTSTVGTISFANQQTFNVGSKPGAVAIGDIDGDGKPDLAVANSDNISNVAVNPDTISVLRNTSTVGTISFANQLTFATGNIPQSVAIGDIDGDGKPELVVGNTNTSDISLFLNTSSVGSIAFDPKLDFSTGSGRKTVVLAELNDDSKLDIAVPSSNSATLSVFLNTSSIGTLSLANRSDYSVGANPFSLAAGDINGDSKPELVTGNLTDNTVSILSRHQNTSLTVSISDQGHSGSGGPLTDNDTIPLVTD